MSFYVQGFRKVDPDRWEFANEGFLGGQKHLLKTIKRRRVSYHHRRSGPGWPCRELGYPSLEPELARLKRSRSGLVAEIESLRQQQLEARGRIGAMEARLQRNERRQQQMMTFLAKALSSPGFIRGLVQQEKGPREICGAETGRKRRLAGRRRLGFEDWRVEERAMVFPGCTGRMDRAGYVDPGGPGRGDSGTVSETILEELLSKDLMGGDPEEEILVGDQPEADVEVEI